MGKKDPRLSAKQIERLMRNPYKVSFKDQKEAGENSRRSVTFRGTPKDFDVLNAEEILSLFGAFLRNVISRYEENKRLQDESEARENDLRHCMELVDGLTEKERRMIYSRLTDTLRTRRVCKAENEILYPLFNEIQDKALIAKLGRIQGQIASAKEVAGNRAYSCRTSVLDDFRAEPDEKESAVG